MCNPVNKEESQTTTRTTRKKNDDDDDDDDDDDWEKEGQRQEFKGERCIHDEKTPLPSQVK